MCVRTITIITMYSDNFFTSDRKTFAAFFKVRRHVIGCINHDIVVGLFYELYMCLSYYIHLGYGKKALSTHGNRTTVLSIVNVYFAPLDQSGDNHKYCWKCKSMEIIY